MKKYKVYGTGESFTKVERIEAGSPWEAYQTFLAQHADEMPFKNSVGVEWGMFGVQVFHDHLKDGGNAGPAKRDGKSQTDSLIGERVHRRSGWAILQFVCGAICIIVGLFFLEEGEHEPGILFLIIGAQGFFIGFLINVFTDIRWFLQESLRIQGKTSEAMDEISKKLSREEEK